MWYSIYKMNEMNDDNWNEQDAATARLLAAVCEGVEVPTEEEEDETLDMQSSD